MSTGDLELLAKYSRQGAEDAFAEIVRRHAGLVYATALRVTRSPQLAEEAAQAVFLELARNAGKLRPDTVLAAWLYAVTRRIAAKSVRGETRRLIREQTAYAMNAAEQTPAPTAELEPLLDDALDALTETDRKAVLLRFFEDKSLADVGKVLGVSADAAQKRVSRAVEQMRAFFSQRGIATGTVAVTALLAANSAKAAPAGLVASICTSVHASLPLTTATLIKAATMTTLQKSLIATTLAVAAGTVVYQTNNVSNLRGQVQSLQQELNATAIYPGGSARTHKENPKTASASKTPRARLTQSQAKSGILDLAKQGIGAFGRAKMNQLIEDVAVEDIPGLLALVDETLSPDLRLKFRAAWLERWAGADAPAAFAYANSLKEKSEHAAALETVFGHWVDQDLATATKTVEALKGDAKDPALNALVGAWMLKEPAAALNWGIANDQHPAITNQLAIRMAETRPQDVWQWALSRTDPEEREGSLRQLAVIVAKSNPVEVATFVASQEPGDSQLYIANEVVGSWAVKDPVAAAQWAMEFPDEGYRARAVGNIARIWAGKDPDAAATWIQSLPAGNPRDFAGLDYTQQVAGSAPERAVKMIESMRPSDMREMAITDLAHAWMKTDPAAATEWLKGIGKTPDEVLNKMPAGWELAPGP